MLQALFIHRWQGYAVLSGACGRVAGSSINKQSALLWTPAVKFGYRYGSSASSARTGSQISLFSRRHLIPLVRLLHPDMHAMSSAEVRQNNAACIQDLYSIVDYMDEMYRMHGLNKQNNGDAGATASGVKASPLQKSYLFNFYACTPLSGETEVTELATGSNEAKDEKSRPSAPLRQFKVTIKPPLAFSGLGAGANLTASQVSLTYFSSY